MKGVMRLLLHEIYGGSSKKKTQNTYYPWQRPSYYPKPPLPAKQQTNSDTDDKKQDTYYPWQRPAYYPKPPSAIKKQLNSETVEDKSDKPLSIPEQYITEENTPKNATLFQSPSEDNNTAKTSALIIQQGLNLVGMKDKNGNALKEDGLFGAKTQETFNRYWDKRFPTKPNYLSSIVKTSSFPYPAISNYYTEPEANSWNFSSYPVTSSHPTSTSFDSSKQEFDITDDIGMYKKELRAAQKRKEQEDVPIRIDYIQKRIFDNSYLTGDYAKESISQVGYPIVSNGSHDSWPVDKYIYTDNDHFTIEKSDTAEDLHTAKQYYVKTGNNQYLANSEETPTYTPWKKIDFNFEKILDEKIKDATKEKVTLFKIYEQSHEKGSYDFKKDLKADTLYYFDGKIYNRNEAGNIIWGYLVAQYSPFIDIGGLGAHAYSLKSQQRWDEPWDQAAIAKGRRYYLERTFGKE